MNLNKRPPMRSRRLLDAAEGQACVICGSTQETIAAHYSGLYASSVGKGLSEKAWDHVSAQLCWRHHVEMDGYVHGNDDARAIRFMLAIFETQRRLFDRGVLVVAPRAEWDRGK